MPRQGDIPSVGPLRPQPNATALRWVGVGFLAAALVAGPLLFGAVETWAWAAVFVLVALAAIVGLAAWVREGSGGLVAAPIFFLVLFLLALAVFQLLPLPSRLVSIMGERTIAARRALALGRHAGISLVPSATLDSLLKIVCVSAAVFATLALVRTRAMLYLLVAAAGAAILFSSALGIMQADPQGEKIYWVRDLSAGAQERTWRSFRLDEALSSGVSRIESTTGDGPIFFARSVNVGDVFGPYANSNHFGGLVAIVVPVLLAFLVALMGTRRGGWGEEGGFASTVEGGCSLIILLAIMLSVGAAVYARSAGALASIAAGFATVLVLMLARAKTARPAWAFIFALAAVGLAGGLYFRAEIAGRLPDKAAGRLDVWEDAARASRDFPMAGSGLGTYRHVAPRYESTELKYLFAHNDYLQFALEGGLIAAGIAAVLVIWQFVQLARGALARQDIYMSALAAGAAGSMAAIGVHSMVDFNLRIPANALVLSVLVAAGAAAARAYRQDIETVDINCNRVLANRTRAIYGALAGLLVLTASGVLIAAMVYADRAKADARTLLAGPEAAAVSPARLSLLSDRLSRAASVAPWDGELAYMRARTLYAWASVETDEALAARHRSESLRRAAQAFALSPPSTHYAMTAVSLGADGLNVIERWQISSFGYKRRLAVMLFDEGRVEDGLAAMRDAIDLEAGAVQIAPQRAIEAVVGLVSRFGSYERIRQAAPESFGGRMLFAAGLAAAGLDSAAGQQYLAAAHMAADARRRDGFNEPVVRMLASRLHARGHSDALIGFYEKVLAREGGWHYLRLDYAGQLAREGRLEDADKQIEIILSDKASRALMDDARELRSTILTPMGQER